MVRNFRDFKKGECPICYGQKKDCRASTISELIFCRHDDHNHPHYIQRGYDSQNLFIRYAPRKQNDASVEYARKRAKAVAQFQEDNTVFDLVARNTAMQSVLKSAKRNVVPSKYAQNLSKRGVTDEMIEKFGWHYINKNTDSQSLTYLPGFNPEHKYNAYPGIIIPFRDYDENVISAQILTADDKVKYPWLGKRTVNGKLYDSRNQYGEYPLNVTKNLHSGIVGLCEGGLKSALAAEKYDWSFIGAWGNNFALSPNTLKETVAKFGSNKTYVYCPDYKGFSNKQIRSKTKDVIKLFQNWGIKLYVVDWGQLFEAKDNQPEVIPLDIDEIDLFKLDFVAYPPEVFLKARGRRSFDLDKNYIDKEKFLSMLPSNIVKALNTSLDLKAQHAIAVNTPVKYTEGIGYVSSQLNELIETGNKTFFIEAADQEATELRKQFLLEVHHKTDYRYILDNSPTGTGKSYVNGELNVTEFFPLLSDNPADIDAYNNNHKILLCKPQPRNPTTLGEETNYHEMPARNNGLYKVPGKTTPAGNPVLKRPKTKDEWKAKEPGNCIFTKTFHAIYEHEIDGLQVCKSCKFKKSCGSANEKRPFNSGYLHEKQVAMTKPMIRMSAAGLSSNMFDGNKQNVVIVDEPSTSLALNKVSYLTQNTIRDLSLALARFGDYKLMQDVLKYTNSFITKDGIPSGLYGLNYLELQPLLPKITDKKLKKILERCYAFRDFCNNEYFPKMLISGKDFENISLLDPSILIKFFEGLWGDRSDLTFTYKKGCLEISARNDRVTSCINKANLVVFQDATLTKHEMALMLDISEDEILEIHTKRPSLENIDIEIIYGLGGVGKNRTENTDEKLNTFLAKMYNTYGGKNVGVIDHVGKREGCLYHHSDAIGSNLYQNKIAQVMIGAPLPNINGLLAEYEIIKGKKYRADSDAFKQFYNGKVRTLIIQEIGRLRANRRLDQKLKICILTEHKLPFLEQEGYKVKYLPIIKYGEELASSKQRNLLSILKACIRLIKDGYTKITQKDIQKTVDITQSAMSKLVGGFKNFITEFKETIDQIKEFIADREYCLEILKAKLGDAFMEIVEAANFDIPGYFRDMENGDITEDEFLQEIDNYKQIYADDWNTIIAMLPIKVRAFLLYSTLKNCDLNVRSGFVNSTEAIRVKLREYERLNI